MGVQRVRAGFVCPLPFSFSYSFCVSVAASVFASVSAFFFLYITFPWVGALTQAVTSRARGSPWRIRAPAALVALAAAHGELRSAHGAHVLPVRNDALLPQLVEVAAKFAEMYARGALADSAATYAAIERNGFAMSSELHVLPPPASQPAPHPLPRLRPSAGREHLQPAPKLGHLARQVHDLYV